jgi:hypothetical protein
MLVRLFGNDTICEVELQHADVALKLLVDVHSERPERVRGVRHLIETGSFEDGGEFDRAWCGEDQQGHEQI